ncbi:hypothetical protein V6N13_149035 [Hibiscus sabdariffa]
MIGVSISSGNLDVVIKEGMSPILYRDLVNEVHMKVKSVGSVSDGNLDVLCQEIEAIVGLGSLVGVKSIGCEEAALLWSVWLTHNELVFNNKLVPLAKFDVDRPARDKLGPTGFNGVLLDERGSSK